MPPQRRTGADIAPGLPSLRAVLRRMDELRGEISRAEWQLKELQAAALRATSRLSPVRYRGMAKHSSMEAAALGTVDLERDLQELSTALDALAQQVRPKVEGLPAGARRTIVHMRFLDGMSCETIALRLHYSRSYIYKVLGEGIQEMEAAGLC